MQQAIPSLETVFTQNRGMSVEEKLDMTITRLAELIENRPAGQGKYNLAESINAKINKMNTQIENLFEYGTWDDNGDDIEVQDIDKPAYTRRALKPVLDTAAIIQDAIGYMSETQLLDKSGHKEALGGSNAIDATQIKNQIYTGIQTALNTAAENNTPIAKQSLVNTIRGFSDLFDSMGTLSNREVGLQDRELPKFAKGIEPKVPANA